MQTRRTLLKTGAAGAAAFAVPAAAEAQTADSAPVDETVDQKIARLVASVAPLRTLKINPLEGQPARLLQVAWQPTGELIAILPDDQPDLVQVQSLIVPPGTRNAAFRLYQGWGGRVSATAPAREYSFLEPSGQAS